MKPLKAGAQFWIYITFYEVVGGGAQLFSNLQSPEAPGTVLLHLLSWELEFLPPDGEFLLSC